MCRVHVTNVTRNKKEKKASLRLSTSTCVFLLTDNSGRSPLFLFYFIYPVVLFSVTGCHLSPFVFFQSFLLFFISFLCFEFFLSLHISISFSSDFSLFICCCPVSPAVSVGTEWLLTDSSVQQVINQPSIFLHTRHRGATAGGPDTCLCLPPLRHALSYCLCC